MPDPQISPRPISASPARAQVFVLAAAQALFQTASVMVMAVGALAGAKIAPHPALATLPVGAMFLGTAAAMFPASMWMARVGRRPGFLLGAGLGVAGGLVAAAGIWISSLILLAFGTFLIGTYQSFAQFYRFAAGEVADDAFRARAISLVMAGGVIAALFGPLLGRYGAGLLAVEYSGSFLLLSAISIAAMLVLLGLGRGGAAPVAAVGSGRSWREIVSQPAYLVALFGAATGYGVMILAMTATPLAMKAHHHGLDASTTVIQMHVLGMFLPSFFTGALVSRFGTLRIMLTGVAVLTGHVLLTMTGTGFSSFASALVLLGIGWNFLYIGGTTLLTTTYTAAERGRAQATNDMTIFAIGIGCSFGAATLLNHLGWQRLNLMLLPWLAAAALALIWLAARQGRARVGQGG
ncbi:MFS transporter [Paracoccus aminophilus]|uniref:Major facilitator family protein n=1 Tax=Paracoccus aminophilus JCM 7686 TaxID=1367847 RepID=S5Y063_PARAH|nr:MFS transporter [Paracoccus aminophilus]AGT10932.1 major facilitator family protein [Paracoccus aminophilus JCM 7686]